MFRRSLILVLLPVGLLAGDLQWTEKGIGFHSGTMGSGIQGRYGRFPSESCGFVFEGRFFDLKGSTEMVSVDQFTGAWTTVGGISLIMFPVSAGIVYFPFVGEIANNFAPFVTALGGLNLIFDAPETGSFFERWGQARRYSGIAGFVGAGIAFTVSSYSGVNVVMGYDMLPLSKTLDGSDDYSGLVLKISYNRRK